MGGEFSNAGRELLLRNHVNSNEPSPRLPPPPAESTPGKEPEGAGLAWIIIFFLVAVAPAVGALVGSMLKWDGVAVLSALLGGPVAGIACGVMLGRRLGKTPGARLGVGIIVSLVMIFVSCFLCAVGCGVGGFTLDTR